MKDSETIALCRTFLAEPAEDFTPPRSHPEKTQQLRSQVRMGRSGCFFLGAERNLIEPVEVLSIGICAFPLLSAGALWVFPTLPQWHIFILSLFKGRLWKAPKTASCLASKFSDLFLVSSSSTPQVGRCLHDVWCHQSRNESSLYPPPTSSLLRSVDVSLIRLLQI